MRLASLTLILTKINMDIQLSTICLSIFPQVRCVVSCTVRASVALFQGVLGNCIICENLSQVSVFLLPSQTFRNYREVFEEQKVALEQRYRSLLEDAVQDAIFLSSRNSDLELENQGLKQGALFSRKKFFPVNLCCTF